MQREKGFTLVELLVVVGIIGFLVVVLCLAIAPLRRLRESRNMQRWAAANDILTAVLQKQVDGQSSFDGATSAPVITQTDKVQVIVADDTNVVCNDVAARPGCAAQPLDTSAANKNCVANLSGLVPGYLQKIPLDLTKNICGSKFENTCATVGDLPIGVANSGYYIRRTVGGRIEIGSCQPELNAVISAKR